jgi:phage tail tube protein FII
VEDQSIELQRLKGAAVYDAAGQLLGRASEIILPQPQWSFREHRGLGSAFSIELPGPLKQPIAIFVWANGGTLLEGFQPVRLTCRCRLRDCTTNGNPSDDQQVVCNMTGTARDLRHSNRTELNLLYFQLCVGTTEIEVFDSFSSIWRRRGRDLIPSCE